jgi:hypothetical protein
MGRGEPEFNLREKADYGGKNIVHAGCWGTCPQKLFDAGAASSRLVTKLEGV